VGAILGAIDESGAAAAPAANGKSQKAAAPAPAKAEATRPAQNETLSPAVRKLVGEKKLDPAAIQGTGKGGQLLKGDVLSAGANAVEALERAPVPPPAPASIRVPSVPGDERQEERVRMTKLRQTIARRLKEAQNTAAMLTTFNEVDMSAIMETRNQYKDLFEKKHHVKLGFMGFFVKACVQALKEIPSVNAEIDGTDIIYKNYYHVGVAVGTERGLVMASCPSRKCRAAPSPSPTAAFTAR
jgi:2-oxoglutarate dehydrogenase E2 component (dihydrolipoamide succinyltransferase)